MGLQSNSQLNLLPAHYLLIATAFKQDTAAVPTLQMSQQRPMEILKLAQGCSARRDSDKNQARQLFAW